ncbi:hypothetical protein NP233_g3751 [Leucocoprinus birnbaumii]|uniref:DUF6532 domain-containing protein n=1 Tax=Leucocoprinus birnbaumii TaxID=56174 RepID=A0AAD5VVZ5_9AGAR|nr:hypothetical protein NP233_g3751 [Leucocoprinus birnbaumii]
MISPRWRKGTPCLTGFIILTAVTKDKPATRGKRPRGKSPARQGEEPGGHRAKKTRTAGEKQATGKATKQLHDAAASKSSATHITVLNQLPLPLDDSENEGLEEDDDDERGDDDDQDEFDDEPEDDTSGLSEAMLQQLIGTEGARIVSRDQTQSASKASRLFDNNDNVIQAGNASVDKDHDDGDEYEDEDKSEGSDNEDKEDDREEEIFENEPDQPRSKTMTRKAQQVQDEAVIVRDKPSHKAALNTTKKNRVISTSTKKPRWATIKPGRDGKKPNKGVVEMTAATVNAWPEVIPGGREKVYDIIDEIGDGDSKFSQVVGNWVVDCLCSIRGDLADLALDHVAIFQLGVKDVCKHHVEQLKIADIYIYPGKWERDAQNPDKVGTISDSDAVDLPSHPKLITGDLVMQLEQDIPERSADGPHPGRDSSAPKHPSEEELPMCMIALAATALYAALVAWESGKCQAQKFEADQFKSTYDHHIDYLKAMKRENLNAYHKITSNLLEYATNGAPKKGPRHHIGNALAVADFSGYD